MIRHALVLASLCAPVPAATTVDVVGEVLDEVSLEEFHQTEAQEYDDFVGRAVLIEFFAHW